MTPYARLITLLALLTFASCTNQAEKGQGKEGPDETVTIRELTAHWSQSLAKQDLQALKSLYDEQVILYGTSLSKAKVIAGKQDFFKKYPDFNQSITDDMAVTKIDGQQYEVSFPKRSSFGGKTIDVQGYLIFRKVSDGWKITEEGDETTDKNLRKRRNPQNGRELTTCIDVVEAILTTSPAFVKKTQGLAEAVRRNGGSGFGTLLEGSPDPHRDRAMEYSRTFDFSLHESYPDRNVTTDRYSFDPDKRQLFEYDIAEDELKSISFDQGLLLQFNTLCK